MPIHQSDFINKIANGEFRTILAATTLATAQTGTNTYPAIEGLAQFSRATIKVTVAKTITVQTGAVNLYLQTSPDQGTSWTDIAALTQIGTILAGPAGTYTIFLNGRPSVGEADLLVKNCVLTANNVRNISFCDRIRPVAVVHTSLETATVTLTVTGFFQE